MENSNKLLNSYGLLYYVFVCFLKIENVACVTFNGWTNLMKEYKKISSFVLQT